MIHTSQSVKNAADFSHSDNAACLLIHGYGGSPKEMEELAAAFSRSGIDPVVLCLLGHGEDRERLAEYHFDDWLCQAETVLRSLLKNYDEVFLLGFSLGGALALNLGARIPLAGLVAISAPIRVLPLMPRSCSEFLLSLGISSALIKSFFQRKQVIEGSEIDRAQNMAPWLGNRGAFPLCQLLSIRSGCNRTRTLLPGLVSPTLLIHDVGDKLVPVENAATILETISSDDKQMIITSGKAGRGGNHLLPVNKSTAPFVAERAVHFCSIRL